MTDAVALLPPKPGPDDQLYAWAQYYAAHGIVCIPIRRGTKRPLIPWKEFYDTPPTDDHYREWFQSYTARNRGIAAVLGPVSGNLVVVDMDYRPLVEWVRADLDDVLRATWTTDTGSDKLHLWLRSEAIFGSTQYRLERRLLADLKAFKGYVMLEPSVHPSGGRYRTRYGSPATCATVPDGRLIASRLVGGFQRAISSGHVMLVGRGDDYTPGTNGTSPNGTPPASTARVALPDFDPYAGNGMRILPPLEGEARERLRLRIRDDRKIPDRGRRAILQDESEQPADWRFDYPETQRGSDWHSEVHLSVMRYLHDFMRCDEDEMELIYATFGCGQLVYANQAREHHGWSIVHYEWTHKMQLTDRGTTKPEELQGLNFETSGWRFYDYGEHVIYTMEVSERSSGRVRTLSVDEHVFYNYTLMRHAITAKISLLAQFPPQYVGKNYVDGFVKRFLDLAEESEVPDELKSGGAIRHVIARYALHELYERIPEYPHQASVAWADGEFIKLRAGSIMSYLRSTMRQPPTAQQVWAAMLAVGALRERYTYKDATTEEVWTVYREEFIRGGDLE